MLQIIGRSFLGQALGLVLELLTLLKLRLIDLRIDLQVTGISYKRNAYEKNKCHHQILHSHINLWNNDTDLVLPLSKKNTGVSYKGNAYE